MSKYLKDNRGKAGKSKYVNTSIKPVFGATKYHKNIEQARYDFEARKISLKEYIAIVQDNKELINK